MLFFVKYRIIKWNRTLPPNNIDRASYEGYFRRQLPFKNGRFSGSMFVWNNLTANLHLLHEIDFEVHPKITRETVQPAQPPVFYTQEEEKIEALLSPET